VQCLLIHSQTLRGAYRAESMPCGNDQAAGITKRIGQACDEKHFDWRSEAVLISSVLYLRHTRPIVDKIRAVESVRCRNTGSANDITILTETETAVPKGAVPLLSKAVA